MSRSEARISEGRKKAEVRSSKELVGPALDGLSEFGSRGSGFEPLIAFARPFGKRSDFE
jgi:hypothetical protein